MKDLERPNKGNMIYSHSEISLCVDAMIIEALAADPSIIKNAGATEIIESALGKIKDYFNKELIDKDHKAESVLNLLSPVALPAVFSLFGMGWWGFIVSMGLQAFNVNVGGIIVSLYDWVKNLVSSGKQTTSQEIDSQVDASIASNSSPIQTTDTSKVIDDAVGSDMFEKYKIGSDYSDIKKRLRDARIIKLMMIECSGNKGFTKTAISPAAAIALKPLYIRVLKSVFGWIFKMALGSALLIAAGDAINSYLGRKPSGGFVVPPIQGQGHGNSTPVITSTQTRFKQKKPINTETYNIGDEVSTRNEGFSNDENGISNMLVQFAKETYEGLDGLEDFMKSNVKFKEVVDKIELFNGPRPVRIVFIPRDLHSNKQIVDLFIDDIAEKAPKPTA